MTQSSVASARLRPEPIDVAAWRQAMEGVTPEGWTVRVGQDGSLRLCIAGEPESGPVSLRNAQWVARCTVPAVLPLLDALAAKDRELAEADAEIVSSHCLIAEERQMRFAAERALDEAMAALRVERERVKALEDVLEPFAKAAKDCDVSDDLRIGVVKPADVIWESAVAVSITFGHVDRARSAMENSKAALADANSNQSTQNIGKNVSEDGQPVSGSREQRGNEEGSDA